MGEIRIQLTDNRYVVSFDAEDLTAEFIERLTKRLRLEYLIRKAQFDDEQIETVFEEAKESWWQKNKASFLTEIEQ